MWLQRGEPTRLSNGTHMMGGGGGGELEPGWRRYTVVRAGRAVQWDVPARIALGRLVGAGSFGVVAEATAGGSEGQGQALSEVAIKRLGLPAAGSSNRLQLQPAGSSAARRLLRELAALRRLRGTPNIVELKAAYARPASGGGGGGGAIYLVFERLVPLPAVGGGGVCVVRSRARELLGGLGALHGVGCW